MLLITVVSLGVGIGAMTAVFGVAAWVNHSMNVAVASIPFGIPIRISFGLDGRVMAVAVLLALGATLIFGLLPALEGSRPNLVAALKGEGGGGRPRNVRLRNFLVGAQCAASVVLLVGASLFVRAMSNATQVGLGLDPHRIAVATKKLDAEGLGVDEGLRCIRDLQATLAANSDMESVHIARSMEMTLMSLNPTLAVEVEVVGYVPTDPEGEDYWRNSVTPGYLNMLGVPVLRGRAPPGSGEDVTEKRTFRIVGIAKDGKYFDFDDSPMPYYWTSIHQDYASRIVVAAPRPRASPAPRP